MGWFPNDGKWGHRFYAHVRKLKFPIVTKCELSPALMGLC